MKLEELRHKPGYRFKEAGRSRAYMVLQLAAGMIRDGDASGGKGSVAVVSLQAGVCMFMPVSTIIEYTS